MFLEYLFFDKDKRPEVESFNDELVAHWSKAKKDGLPPAITYKDFDETDHWIVKFEKDKNREQEARQLSEINKKICEKFSPTVLTDESSEYFNKNLYPLVNKFERYLRKLLYLQVALCNEEKLKSAILVIEKKDFGTIYDILFVDHDFRTKARKEIDKLNTRAEMLEAIDRLRERTAWDILIGDSVLTIVKDNFDQLKEYRNDVMHAHNISYDRFNDIKNLLTKANSELEEQISGILQYPPTTTVSATTVDTLYDKLVKKGADHFHFDDLFTELSTAVPSEALDLERLCMLLEILDGYRKAEGPLEFSSAVVRRKKYLANDGDEVSTHE